MELGKNTRKEPGSPPDRHNCQTHLINCLIFGQKFLLSGEKAQSPLSCKKNENMLTESTNSRKTLLNLEEKGGDWITAIYIPGTSICTETI
eukprot:snap_masked-scaffold_3-processed-gene-6.6-mRNA-1 protein AED:1.00 eAED:1.00 QI:0/0/0/0/1/1/2/0/90